MKLHTWIVVGAVGMGVMGFAAGSAYVRGQSPSAEDLLKQSLARRYAELRTADAGRFVTSTMLNDDVKLVVVQTERGDYRGRLFVKIGESWEPVAAEGIGDISGILPAKLP